MLCVSLSVIYLFHFQLCSILQVWFLRKQTDDHFVYPFIQKGFNNPFTNMTEQCSFGLAVLKAKLLSFKNYFNKRPRARCYRVLVPDAQTSLLLVFAFDGIGVFHGISRQGIASI